MGYFDREWSITDMTNPQQPTIPAAPISLVTPKTTPGVTPVTAPKLPATFDAEEGMYDAYIKARNESIGANASKRKLERFYKKFRKQWDEGEALRRSEFNWNQGMAEANKRIDDMRQNFTNRALQMVLDFKNSFKPFENPKPAVNTPVVNTPVQLESAYARAKREGNTRSLVGQDPHAAAAISAEEQNIVPTTRGFGDRQVSVNPDDFGYNDDLLVSPSTKQNNIFSSNTFNSAGKKFTGTFNTMEEFNDAFTDWHGKRKGFWSGGSYSEGKKWDSARDNMLQQYLKFHNLTSLPNAQKPKSSSNDVVQPWRVVAAHENGGNINKYQQGGTIINDQELQKAFMAYLIEDAAAQGMLIQSEQDLQAYAQQLGEEGLKAKYQEFMQKMQGGVKADLGAKLNYIHKLKGNCPEGEELVYMKQGGRMCPVCQKKAEKAENGKKLPKKNAVSDFKEKRKQINPNDTVNTKFGPRDLNGKTNYKKYDAKKENYDFETRMRVQEKDEKSGKKVIGSACGSKMKKKK